MHYVAGWSSTATPQVFTSLGAIVDAFPEIFYVASPEKELDENGELISVEPENITELMLLLAVEMVNNEGNYHDFIFRPAFQFEVDQHAK